MGGIPRDQGFIHCIKVFMDLNVYCTKRIRTASCTLRYYSVLHAQAQLSFAAVMGCYITQNWLLLTKGGSKYERLHLRTPYECK